MELTNNYGEGERGACGDETRQAVTTGFCRTVLKHERLKCPVRD